MKEYVTHNKENKQPGKTDPKIILLALASISTKITIVIFINMFKGNIMLKNQCLSKQK